MIPIIITGEANSGKSLLAALLRRELGYDAVNVGDLLALKLERDLQIVPKRREEIGRIYFMHFGLQDYVSLVASALAPQVALDGLRLADAIRALRQSSADFLHVHRIRLVGPPRVREPYVEEVGRLETLADIVEQPPHSDEPTTPDGLTKRLLGTITAGLAAQRGWNHAPIGST